MLQEESGDVVTIVSTTDEPFLGMYRASADLVASADDAAMSKAYVVGMAVP
jgi:hypothetical protein